jgi:hypothetical protein
VPETCLAPTPPLRRPRDATGRAGRCAGHLGSEVSLRHDGHNYDVTLREDTTFAEIEREIAAGDLPRPVSDAVRAKYPRAEVGKAEEVTKGDTKRLEVHLKEGVEVREPVLDAAGIYPSRALPMSPH